MACFDLTLQSMFLFKVCQNAKKAILIVQGIHPIHLAHQECRLLAFHRPPPSCSLLSYFQPPSFQFIITETLHLLNDRGITMSSN